MTTTNGLQGQIDFVRQYAEDLQTQLDAMKKAEGEREWPQKNDGGFLINPDGGIAYYVWTGNPTGKCVLDQGNLFQFEAEAIRERDRRALIAELRRHPKACPFRPNDLSYRIKWNGHSWDWHVADMFDACPASGHFVERVPGLIEQYRDRLDLLRSA